MKRLCGWLLHESQRNALGLLIGLLRRSPGGHLSSEGPDPAPLHGEAESCPYGEYVFKRISFLMQGQQ